MDTVVFYKLKNITNILCNAIAEYTHEVLIIILKLVNISPESNECFE